MDQEELLRKLKEKIIDGEKLMMCVTDIKNVNGVEKLKKKIKQEINFLLKISDSKEAKKEHLLCTNLHHFEALVSTLISSRDALSVLQYFSLAMEDGSAKRICVDVVADNGHLWTKVIARNPKALSQLSFGDGEFGQRSILDHAMEYLECARQHPHLFKAPRVIFEFACGIERTLAEKLESLGVIVTGEKLERESALASEEESDGIVFKDFYDTTCSDLAAGAADQKLNLDVTAMLAYVSSLTNGKCNFEFKEPLLTQQAEWERARPVKPVLDQVFEGKSLICCESAMKDFKSIVSTLGGPGEKDRANELLSRVSVVPDLTSSRAESNLRLGGKIKQRSLAVFSTGDALKAITVTANEGFIRAARNQGVEFAVFVHESRALTESKEQEAKLIILAENESQSHLTPSSS